MFKGVLLVLEVDVVLGQEAGEFVGESQFSSAPHLGFVEYFRRVTSTHLTYATETNDSVIDRERLGTIADRTIKAIVPSITKETSSTEDVFPHPPHALLLMPSTLAHIPRNAEVTPRPTEYKPPIFTIRCNPQELGTHPDHPQHSPTSPIPPAHT
jgi:hypothetical protein